MSDYRGTEWEVACLLDKPVSQETLSDRLEEGYQECVDACIQVLCGMTQESRDDGYHLLRQEVFHHTRNPRPVIGTVALGGFVYVYITTPSLPYYTFVTKFRNMLLDFDPGQMGVS